MTRAIASRFKDRNDTVYPAPDALISTTTKLALGYRRSCPPRSGPKKYAGGKCRKVRGFSK